MSRNARQIAVTDPIKDPSCCALVFQKYATEEDAMNDALFALLSNYRERASKLTGISKKTFSRIKAKSGEVVLVPRKPLSDEMKPCDFIKCRICINFKITNKTTNYI